jgi:hypothetical protein
MMYVQIVSLVVRAIKGLIKRSQENTVATHYLGYRWCDSTERALNEQLMGRRNWIGDRF